MLDILFGVVLALQSTAPQQQRGDNRTWYQAYADGQQKVQNKDFKGGIADIELASRRGAPKPARSVRYYGDVYREFNPDYYLGVAYLGLERYEEADRAFGRVKQADLIRPADALFATFARQLETAKTLSAKPPTTQVATGQPAPSITPSGGTGLPPVRGTSTSLGSPSSPAPSAPDGTTAPYVPSPSAQQYTPPQPPPIQRPTGPGTAARGPSNTSVRPISPSPAAPDLVAERSALIDFFSGEYERSRTALAALATKGNASPRAYFYLASSLVALGLSGRIDKDPAIAAARVELQKGGSPSQFAPDLTLISPRIRLELGLTP